MAPFPPEVGAEVRVGEAQGSRPLLYIHRGGFRHLGWGHLPGHHLWTHLPLPGPWDLELPGKIQTLRPSMVARQCGSHKCHPKDQGCLWIPAPPEVGRV